MNGIRSGNIMIDIFDSEQQVETMIVEGRQIMDAAIALYKPVAIVAAFSGGDDSIVSTHFAAAEYDVVVLNCDTTTGVAPTMEHVARVGRRFHWDLRSVRADVQGPPEKLDDGSPFDPAILPCGRWTDGGSAYEDFTLNFGFPGPGQHGRMYQRLKQRAIRKLQGEMKAGGKRTATVLIVSGIRHDESSVRAGYRRDTQREHRSSLVWVNPFYWRTALDFEAYRQEFSLPRNPVKAAIGVSGECNCGAYAGNAELAAIREVDPCRADYLAALEGRVRSINGFPWGWGQDPPRWYVDAKRGQGFLFDSHAEDDFRPMCVGCVLRR